MSTGSVRCMIGIVRIQNFKSIRDLEFEPRRVNLFIGEPNTGKSNVIEALAFFSLGEAKNFKEIFRFKTIGDLFFDQKVASEISVQAGKWRWSLKFGVGSFQGTVFEDEIKKNTFTLNHQGNFSQTNPVQTSIRFYAFKPQATFPNPKPGILNPPFGDNLVAVLYSNEDLRQRIGATIRAQGFRLQLKPTESELLITKDVKDELYSYPWTSVSETLRRVAFKRLPDLLELDSDAFFNLNRLVDE